MNNEIRIVPDAEAAGRAAAELLLPHLARPGGEGDPSLLVLSGGRTPGAVYTAPRTLAAERGLTPPLGANAEIFFCDERCVPPEHERSNYGLARREMLEPLTIPEERIHRIRGEDEPERAAADYETLLRRHIGETGRAGFDLVFLGMGPDGHTASLFAGHPVLEETTRWVAVSEYGKRAEPRVTMTYPLLNRSRHVVILALGEEKAEVVRDCLETDPDRHPVGRVRPRGGTRTWILTREAASLLSEDTLSGAAG